MRKTDWLTASMLALCIVGLAACGGGDSGSSGGSTSVSREEAGLEFAKCMREHGVEMEDPKPGQNITLENDDSTTRKALAACDGKLRGAGQELSAEEDEEFKEGWLAFSECMREEGIDLADPRFPGNGKVLLGIAGIDTTSPAFEAAAEACKDKVPTQTGGGFGVGG
ncbi:MAG TPA: hypothetical protein VFI17_01245 [Solirubrobacterales bacterium]|nr:hypothetical protein [Solirubrobacterales bacterium]